ncbi:MAG TPA: hypothetical protein VFU55_13930 [Terracidiphilus sp.]|nr:hypothetical protein [Terracidiphilus sp.]
MWIAGTILFIGASFEAARLYVRVMQAWLIHSHASRGDIIEIRFVGMPVFWICLIAGALYASALARPSHFGGLPRIWRHLAITFLLFLFACVPAVPATLIRFPDFAHDFERNAYLFILLSLPVVCFVLGILAWARLAFAGRLVSREGNSEAANPAS